MSYLAFLFVGPAADDAGEMADIMAAVRLVKQRDATVQELMPVRRCMNIGGALPTACTGATELRA
jgi:hypothetical protein